MPREPYERVHYKLELDGSFLGCAWALSQTKLITCAHVASDRAVLIQAVRSYDGSEGTPFRVEITTGTDDWRRDSSLLHSQTQAKDKLLPVNEQGVWEPEAGQRFDVFGFPDDKRTLGDFARYEVGQQLPNGWFKVEIEDLKGSELREGYSGAPAWDPVLHCVIGIVVGVDPKRSEKIAYIIPPSTLREQLGEPSLSYPKFGHLDYERMLSVSLESRELRRVQKFLSSAAHSAADGVERYWIYACLGTLAPDLRARESLQIATEIERDEFALRGAKQALSKFINV